jgi:hypothetical protein
LCGGCAACAGLAVVPEIVPGSYYIFNRRPRFTFWTLSNDSENNVVFQCHCSHCLLRTSKLCIGIRWVTEGETPP